jgi:hypothetical protein
LKVIVSDPQAYLNSSLRCKHVILITKYVTRGILLHEFIHYLTELGRKLDPRIEADGTKISEQNFTYRERFEKTPRLEEGNVKSALDLVELWLSYVGKFGFAAELETALFTGASSDHYKFLLTPDEILKQYVYASSEAKELFQDVEVLTIALSVANDGLVRAKDQENRFKALSEKVSSFKQRVNKQSDSLTQEIKRLNPGRPAR